MYPKAIFIFRHGEKPGQNHVEHMDDGIYLSARGHSRAAAIAHQVSNLFAVDTHKDIDYIFATKESKASIRPIQTVELLAKFCKLKVKAKYADDEYKKLKNEILSKKYDDKIVVVCWHHGKIPDLIKSLGGNTNVDPINGKGWNDNVFDRIIKLNKNEANEIITTSISQALLFGDTFV
jgi:hypothetical protein